MDNKRVFGLLGITIILFAVLGYNPTSQYIKRAGYVRQAQIALQSLETLQAQAKQSPVDYQSYASNFKKAEVEVDTFLGKQHIFYASCALVEAAFEQYSTANIYLEASLTAPASAKDELLNNAKANLSLAEDISAMAKKYLADFSLDQKEIISKTAQKSNYLADTKEFRAYLLKADKQSAADIIRKVKTESAQPATTPSPAVPVVSQAPSVADKPKYIYKASVYEPEEELPQLILKGIIKGANAVAIVRKKHYSPQFDEWDKSTSTNLHLGDTYREGDTEWRVTAISQSSLTFTSPTGKKCVISLGK